MAKKNIVTEMYYTNVLSFFTFNYGNPFAFNSQQKRENVLNVKGASIPSFLSDMYPR